MSEVNAFLKVRPKGEYTAPVVVKPAPANRGAGITLKGTNHKREPQVLNVAGRRQAPLRPQHGVQPAVEPSGYSLGPKQSALKAGAAI